MAHGKIQFSGYTRPQLHLTLDQWGEHGSYGLFMELEAVKWVDSFLETTSGFTLLIVIDLHWNVIDRFGLSSVFFCFGVTVFSLVSI